MANVKWDPDVHDSILIDHNLKMHSLSEAARQMGFAKATIHKHAKRLELSWTRTEQTSAAAQASREEKIVIAEHNAVEANRAIENIFAYRTAVKQGHKKHPMILKKEGGGEDIMWVGFIPPRDDLMLAQAANAYASAQKALEASLPVKLETGNGGLLDEIAKATGGRVYDQLGKTQEYTTKSDKLVKDSEKPTEGDA